MSMQTKEIPSLKAFKREAVGTREVSGIRCEGLVPAQVYGQKQDNLLISLNGHELDLCLRSNPTLVSLDIEGTIQPALIKELQRGTFGSEILHLDLQRVSLQEPVDVNVPIEFFGTPQGAEQGTRLEIMRTSIRIRVRADSIPAAIRVNVNEIEIGTRLMYSGVKLPEGAELLGKASSTVCQVSQSKRAAAAAKEAAKDVKGKKGAKAAPAAKPAAGAAKPPAKK